MHDARQLDTDRTLRTIDRELELVAGAIRMIAGGGAPGMTLIGLEFGPALLEQSAPAALAAGVILEPLWRTDEAGCEIRVVRIASGDDRG